jgi:hypothetical protein
MKNGRSLQAWTLTKTSGYDAEGVRDDSGNLHDFCPKSCEHVPSWRSAANPAMDNLAGDHHAAVHNVVNFAGHRVVVPPSRRSVVLQYQAPFVSHFVLRMVCKG